MTTPSTDPISTELLLQNCRGKLDFAQKLLDMFLDDSQIRLDGLFAALAENDLQAIRAHAHALKGTAATVAATNVRETASQIESAARRNDLSSVPALVSCLESSIEQCKEFSLS